MDNLIRQELVKARDGLEVAILALTELGYSLHPDLSLEQKHDSLNVSDVLKRKLVRVVLQARELGEPTYTTENTSIACSATMSSSETVLWYHHSHPDTGERIYVRIATKTQRGIITLSDEHPAITTQMASNLLDYHS